MLNIKTRKKLVDCRDFNFKNQIERALLSIMNNIAEGFERKTNNEFKYFLFIAKGSCGEVRSMLYLAYDLNYLTKKQSKSLYMSSIEISKMISGFIKKL
ncbi:MAG: four helix bundle protein [Patescibacteria group bacterium]|nr:four helix bundle protein [Patescibacteria group bacterium]